MGRLRRLICRLRGHRWSPWLQWKQWERFDTTTDHYYRSCWRCLLLEAQEAKP